MPAIIVHPEVRQALADATPVVVLESAVITHGLPRMAVPSPLPADLTPQWNVRDPLNLEAARALERTVRDAGAVPATVAAVAGVLHIGLDAESLAELARDERARKASADNLAHILSSGQTAGTTVSATLAACHAAETAGLRVLVTGGIGGVHRGWSTRPDISADLRLIASLRMCVVCSGAKSILDLPATFEALQTLAVPVLCYQTDHIPQFVARGESGPHRLPGAQRVDDPAAAAEVCRFHWEELARPTGAVLANPVPAAFAVGDSELDTALRGIEGVSPYESEQELTGGARTPQLLDRLEQATGGRSLRANLALLLANARLGAEIAAAYQSSRSP